MSRVSYLAVCTFCFLIALASVPCSVQAEDASQPGEREYTPDQIKSTPAEVFLARMLSAEPGYQKFAAMHALGRKAKDSAPEARRAILSLVVATMNDKSRNIYQRWQCCYVISDSGDAQWVPYLVDVLMKDPSETMRAVAAEALGYFTNNAAAKDALLQASQREKSPKVLEVINRRLGQGEKEYTPEQIQNTSAVVFLTRIDHPETGYEHFAAMRALGRKAKDSDPEARQAIISLVVKTMNDTSRPLHQRWQCCYVLSESKDGQSVPYLADVLLNDPSETMRAVAAEALGDFTNNAAATDALLEAYQKETSDRVLEVLKRRLSPSDSEYTPEQIKGISTEGFLERLLKPDPGYAKFAAMHALARKARESDAQTRLAMLTRFVAVMNDTSRALYQRWQCCYVISDSGDERGVPYLIDVLNKDSSEIVRAVAAEALGTFSDRKNKAAHDALVLALSRETSPKVLEVINRRLRTPKASP